MKVKQLTCRFVDSGPSPNLRNQRFECPLRTLQGVTFTRQIQLDWATFTIIWGKVGASEIY